jgi:hypothetical protein
MVLTKFLQIDMVITELQPDAISRHAESIEADSALISTNTPDILNNTEANSARITNRRSPSPACASPQA